MSWVYTYIFNTYLLPLMDAFYFPYTKLDAKIKKILYLWNYVYMLTFLIFCISLYQNIWKNQFLLHLPIKGWIKDLLELMTAPAKHRVLPDCYGHFSSFRAKPEYWFWFSFFFFKTMKEMYFKMFCFKMWMWLSLLYKCMRHYWHI